MLHQLPPNRILRRLFFTSLLLGSLLVSRVDGFQETAPTEKTASGACAKYYLFKFGDYHFYSTVTCRLSNQACTESSNEEIQLFKNRPPTVGCVMSNGSCACQAPSPDVIFEFETSRMQPPPGNARPDWSPAGRNPQGDKWIGLIHSPPKYAKTTADFEGVPANTYYYLLQFQPFVYDIDPAEKIAMIGTVRPISNFQYIAVRLSSAPPAGSTIFNANLEMENGARRLRVAGHDNLFKVEK